jgi:YbbR domain-containing protein
MRRATWFSHVSSIVLAAVLAIIMWFVSSESIAPFDTRSGFPDGAAIPVEWRNVPDGDTIYDPTTREVRVDLRGIRAGLAALAPSDVRAYVDLGGVGPEAVTATLPIRISCARCPRRGVRVVGPDVPTTTVRLAAAATQTRPVTVDFEADVSAGTRVTGSPVSPGQVTLRAAAPVLERVARVVARISNLPDSADETVVPDLAVAALDTAGQPVPDVIIDPEQVTVTLQLRGRGTEVSVRPSIEGTEADGFYVTSISVSPQIVQLDGAPAPLAVIEQEGTVYAMLNIAGATEDVVRRVPLDLPDGVTAVNAPDGVTVTVQVSPLHGTVSVEAAVQTRGLGSGLRVRSVSPRKVDVLVGGPQTQLHDITADDVEVFVDLTGLGAGRHTLSPRPSVPSGYLWRSVSPAIVDVVIEGGSGTPP